MFGVSITSHVGVVDHWFAPNSTTVIFVGSDSKFVGCVGLEVVDYCIRCGAGLVDPLPVSFSIANGVMPGSKIHRLLKYPVDKQLKRHFYPLASALNDNDEF